MCTKAWYFCPMVLEHAVAVLTVEVFIASHQNVTLFLCLLPPSSSCALLVAPCQSIAGGNAISLLPSLQAEQTSCSQLLLSCVL